MSRTPLPDQVVVLRQLKAEAAAEERDQIEVALADTIALVEWVLKHADTIKSVHKAISDPAVTAVMAAFPEAEVAAVRKVGT